MDEKLVIEEAKRVFGFHPDEPFETVRSVFLTAKKNMDRQAFTAITDALPADFFNTYITPRASIL